MKRNDTGFISYSWRGIYKFISYHEVRLPGMDKPARWMAVATSPSSDFTAPASEAARVIGSRQNDTVAGISGMIRGTQMQFLWLGGLVLLVALAAGMVLSAFIVRPIRHLTEVAAQLGQGDRDVLAREVERARVKKDIAGRTDEIGGLAVALDQVIKNLHEDLEKNRRQSAELVRAVQDKPTTMNLEIKDSIIYRSEVGQYGGGPPAPAPESKGYAICPYCGKELRFPRMPSFCPFCRQKLE
jgi:methyl-accepting chemotaxis protein